MVKPRHVFLIPGSKIELAGPYFRRRSLTFSSVWHSGGDRARVTASHLRESLGDDTPLNMNCGLSLEEPDQFKRAQAVNFCIRQMLTGGRIGPGQRVAVITDHPVPHLIEGMIFGTGDMKKDAPAADALELVCNCALPVAREVHYFE